MVQWLDENMISHDVYILSCDEYTRKYDITKSKVAVFAHLYYEELISFCLTYLQNVPEEIDIYITVISDKMKKLIEDQMSLRSAKKYNIIIKENRGRDISSLLVACCEIIRNYDYICFIHDKGVSGYNTQEDINIWLNLMWDNLLRSQSFIYNIINKFDDDDKIGFFMPPHPYGKVINYAFTDGWGSNYENVVELSNKLNLTIDIRKDLHSYSLSTAFWCKTESLNKLFMKEWRYDDFPKEPLPLDGSINHAIERILSYVVMDAGFKVAVLMNDNYAAAQYLTMHNLLCMSFNIFKYFSITNINQLVDSHAKICKLISYTKNWSSIHIYGAGEIGLECSVLLRHLKICIQGFVVSDGHKKTNICVNHPIYELSEIKENLKNGGLILALNDKNMEEVLKILVIEGINDYYIY